MLDLLAFFISSVTALVLTYYKVPTGALQQGTALFLIILLIFYKRFISTNSKLSGKLFRLSLLIASSLSVQLLIIQSGGFKSPFLILLHLYTIGASFLLQMGSAISFLMLSILVLAASIFINPALMASFHQDPGAIALYLVSFFVIIPLSQFVMNTYHIKDALSKLLKENIELEQKREKTILSSLNELVIITDVNLRVLSINDAVEKDLFLPETITGNNLLNVLHLKDQSGSIATPESLSISNMMENRITYIIEGFYLETKLTKQLKVTIQIRPVTGPTGEITQITFVVTDARVAGLQTHANLEKTKQHIQIIFESLSKSIVSGELPAIKARVYLLKKAYEDLLLAQELEDHSFRKIMSLQNLAALLTNVAAKKREFTASLGINLEFQILAYSNLTVLTDPRWLTLFFEELIDIASFLVAGKPDPNISLFLQTQNKKVEVYLSATPVKISLIEIQELFKQDYGKLASRPNLAFGSGLEGFIIKSISGELSLPLSTKVSENRIEFKLEFKLGN